MRNGLATLKSDIAIFCVQVVMLLTSAKPPDIFPQAYTSIWPRKGPLTDSYPVAINWFWGGRRLDTRAIEARGVTWEGSVIISVIDTEI